MEERYSLGQIGKSLGYPTHSIPTFTSLVSKWNYLGRVVAGYVSEILWAKYKFPRPPMLTMIVLFSCVGYVLIAFAVPNSLYFASVIIGFCLGAQLPLPSAIISEIFLALNTTLLCTILGPFRAQLGPTYLMSKWRTIYMTRKL